MPAGHTLRGFHRWRLATQVLRRAAAGARPKLAIDKGRGRSPTPNVPNRATRHLGGRKAIYLEGLRNAPQPGQSRRCPSQVPVYRPSSTITTVELMPVDESSIQARTAGGGPNDPIEVAKHPLRIAAQAIGYPHGTGVAPFIAYCEAAVQMNGWAVIVFHSIGAMPMPTDRLVHQQLLAHLQDRRFWVAPVRDVARYILTSISR